MDKEQKKSSGMRYAGLATQWLVMLLAAVWGGMKLDAVIGWRFPLLTVLLPLVALCISLWQIIKEFNKPNK